MEDDRNDKYVSYRCLGDIDLMLSKGFALKGADVSDRTLMFASSERARHKIAIWIRDGHITDLWFDGGSVKVCKFDSQALDKTVLDEMILAEERYRRFSMFICTVCHREFDIENLGGTRFAGRYCRPCWKKHEEENMQICSLCHKPMHDCTC